MEIILSTLTGESFALDVDATAAVSAVKKKIHEMRGLAPDTQRLILGRRLLEDDYSLASCGVETGATLTLVGIPRPKALLEVEVWPERGYPAYTEYGVPAPTCAFPATIVRACVSGATQEVANGIYSSVSFEDGEQQLARDSYTLRWAERCGENPSGWYVSDQDGRVPRCRVEVHATVRCADDPVMDGTYRPSDNGTFDNGNFTLAWHDAPGSYDGTCFQAGWYVEGSSNQFATHVENSWWWPPHYMNAHEPSSMSPTSTENSSFALCGNLSM
mmetsp:Transcript_118476/g.295620  ORF Transcript_118476/g.295620 Transcript_118476/m.295620 type:complete len:273 (-) Transcript_118476:83-901(-)|eukprot:CAMPEP_0115271264 /NCGR_PEP_ID=MMETSP0270-20121206/54005_1 /TAXON_ID=71861 /ORGANISM="Scrippsiella trochoidea, Strain CCMP3099" /LENGTH=272 /DNA_ID=CAMNT_0002687609 /DNA_START=61 /DNA_END=879 /DNA_ORIENTATION=-